MNTLAGAATAHDSVLEAHDRQIGALITLADKNQTAIDKLRTSTENLERRGRLISILFGVNRLPQGPLLAVAALYRHCLGYRA